MIIFNHIPRTGGTKINLLLQDRLPQRSLVITQAYEPNEAVLEVMRSSDREWFIGGHLGFMHLPNILPNLHPQDCLFSVVRAPASRALSLYYLCLRSPDWLPTLAPIAEKTGFSNFLAAALDLGILQPNQQCRLLSGSPDFSQTREIIGKHYALVGLHSSYDTFLARLHSLLQPALPGLTIDDKRINAAYHQGSDLNGWQPQRPIHDLLDRSDIQRLENTNDQDCALVEYIGAQHTALLLQAGMKDHDRTPTQG